MDDAPDSTRVDGVPSSASPRGAGAGAGMDGSVTPPAHNATSGGVAVGAGAGAGTTPWTGSRAAQPPPPLSTPVTTTTPSALPDGVTPTALVPYHKGSSNALIRHTAFAPTEPDGDDYSRLASTEVMAWGRDDMGQAMREPVAPDGDASAPTGVPKLDRVRIVSVACSSYHTMVVSDSGELYAAGLNDEGQLLKRSGDNDTVRQPMIVDQLGTQRVISVSCGTSHTAVLVASQAVLTFGNNEYGQLGHSPGAAYNVPVRAVRGVGSGARRVVQAACGSEHTLFLCVSGEVFACGNGAYGALGLGNRESQSVAKPVVGLTGVPVTQISAGEYHSVAVTKSGLAYSWGRNRYGQLGVSRETEPHAAYEPRRIDTPELIQQAECGSMHTMLLSVMGNVFAAGRGTSGQLGVGKPSDAASLQAVDTPMVVSLAGHRARQVACGWRHTLVLLSSGDVMAFGSCDMGQLGLPPDGEAVVWTPTLVPSLCNKGVFHVSAGGDTSAAVRVTRGSVLSTAPGSLPRGAMLSMDSATLLMIARLATSTRHTEPLQQVVKDVFSQAAVLNGSFLKRPEFTYYVVKTAPDGPTPDIGLPKLQDSPYNVLISDASPSASHAAGAGAGAGAGASSASDGGDASNTSTALATPSGAFRRPSAPSSVVVLASQRPAGAPVVVQTSFGGTFDDVTDLHTSSWLTSSGVDVRGLDVAFAAIVSTYSPEVRETLLRSITLLLESMAKPGVAANLIQPDSLRCFIPMFLAPVFNSTSPAAIAAFHRLMTVLDALPKASADMLFSWVQRDVPSDVFLSRFVQPMQLHLSYYTRILTTRSVSSPDVAMNALRLVVRTMARLYNANEASGLVDHKHFHNADVCGLPDVLLSHDFRMWASTRNNPDAFTLCTYPFLFDADAKRRILHIDAQQRQIQAFNNSMFQQLFGAGGGSPVFEMRVHRETLLNDTVLALRSVMHPSQLKKPLRVIFVGEEGVDAGGVSKEFFQLLSARLFNPEFGMFVELDSHMIWFNSNAVDDSISDFQLIGQLIGLAIYNRVLLDVQFPLCVYRKLLGRPVGLADLKELDESVGQSMQALLDYEGGDVEDVFCLDFTVGYSDLYGEPKVHELKPDGASIAVTAANKQEYVDLYVKWRVVDSVARQFDAFARGFTVVMDGPAVELFRPEELDLLVSGTPELNFAELEPVMEYDGGFTRVSPAVKMFWTVVHSFTQEQQRKLLLFFTGCAKAPIGGLRKLKAKIQRNGPDSDRLPTASTCFNTMLLPDYGSEDKMRDRLLTAISECQGFGLE